MARKEVSEEDTKRAELEIKFYSEDEYGNSSFDVEKSTRYILNLYDVVHSPKQGYFLFNKKYWERIDDNYLAQLIKREMDLIAKPYYVDQVLKNISYEKYIKLEEINSDRKSIVLQNGTLNISDWENPMFYENEFFREDFCTIYFDYLYDTNAKCPNFNNYLSSTFESNPENIKTVQEMFGYCLTTSTKHEKIFLLYGEGGSGKSVLIDTLKTLVTDANYASVPMSLLDKSFLRAGLKDKILNFSTEECSRLVKDSAITWLKAISSGDPIEAQFKNKDTFNFNPFCKLVFAMNDLPNIDNFDDALQRRFAIIHFSKKFRGDEIDLDLKEGKLHNEMSGILQFALEGLKRLAEQRDFTYSEESKDMLDQYRLESNNAERFAAYYIEVDSKSFLQVNEVYDKYKEFCNENNETYVKNAEFKKIIKRKFGLPFDRQMKKISGKTQEVYEGLTYRDNSLKLVG